MTHAERALLLAVAEAVKELNPGLYLAPLIAAVTHGWAVHVREMARLSLNAGRDGLICTPL